jgi:hypothetical protein
MSGLRSALFLAGLFAVAPFAARADEGVATREQNSTADQASAERPRFNAAANARQGLMLETLIAPGSKQAGRVTAVALSGYDGARQGMTVRSFVDANVFGALDVRMGVSYLPNGVENAA